MSLVGDGEINFEALYLGKAGVVRSRVKGQLNNLRLIQHLERSVERVNRPGLIASIPRLNNFAGALFRKSAYPSAATRL